jgi:hypothetical protein
LAPNDGGFRLGGISNGPVGTGQKVNTEGVGSEGFTALRIGSLTWGYVGLRRCTSAARFRRRRQVPEPHVRVHFRPGGDDHYRWAGAATSPYGFDPPPPRRAAVRVDTGWSNRFGAGWSYAQQMSLTLWLTVWIKFNDAMKHCDNLVEVHQRVGSAGRGRRIETSINRAVVVIAVACWQAVVQDMALFMLDRGMPDPSDPNYPFARLIRGQVMGNVTRFSTPNAQNSRTLLQQVGFDPHPYWSWSTRDVGGHRVTLKPAQVEEQLRDWLQVRHAIAHGDVMPEVNVLQAVRLKVVKQQRSFTAVGPTIRLVDAKQCVTFVRKLTEATLEGLESELRGTA